jgi:hypothetical protein
LIATTFERGRKADHFPDTASLGSRAKSQPGERMACRGSVAVGPMTGMLLGQSDRLVNEAMQEPHPVSASSESGIY